METPQHDDWEIDRHSNPKEAEKIKKEFFRILREKVKEKGKKVLQMKWMQWVWESTYQIYKI